MFAWHAHGGTPLIALQGLGFDRIYSDANMFVVAPYASGKTQYEWFFSSDPENNPDLIFFDDVRACLKKQYDGLFQVENETVGVL